jgi:hypothetical protein
VVRIQLLTLVLCLDPSCIVRFDFHLPSSLPCFPCLSSRLNIDKTLASLSRNGKGVTDTEIVKWANDTVKASGKSSSMRSLKDSNLANGHFFLDLVDSLRPGIVDQSLVEPGNTEDECKLNGSFLAMLLSCSDPSGEERVEGKRRRIRLTDTLPSCCSFRFHFL